MRWVLLRKSYPKVRFVCVSVVIEQESLTQMKINRYIKETAWTVGCCCCEEWETFRRSNLTVEQNEACFQDFEKCVVARSILSISLVYVLRKSLDHQHQRSRTQVPRLVKFEISSFNRSVQTVFRYKIWKSVCQERRTTFWKSREINPWVSWIYILDSA